jgi:hypothetical protein
MSLPLVQFAGGEVAEQMFPKLHFRGSTGEVQLLANLRVYFTWGQTVPGTGQTQKL